MRLRGTAMATAPWCVAAWVTPVRVLPSPLGAPLPPDRMRAPSEWPRTAGAGGGGPTPSEGGSADPSLRDRRRARPPPEEGCLGLAGAATRARCARPVPEACGRGATAASSGCPPRRRPNGEALRGGCPGAARRLPGPSDRVRAGLRDLRPRGIRPCGGGPPARGDRVRRTLRRRLGHEPLRVACRFILAPFDGRRSRDSRRRPSRKSRKGHGTPRGPDGRCPGQQVPRVRGLSRNGWKRGAFLMQRQANQPVPLARRVLQGRHRFRSGRLANALAAKAERRRPVVGLVAGDA